MSLVKKRKRALCALFLFLSSCASCPQWRSEKAVTCDTIFQSERFVYDAQDAFCQIELELVQSSSGLRMYVDTFSRPLSCLKVYPVTLTINEEAIIYTAELLQGGQRLLLPDAARDSVINALLNDQCVQISAGPYQATIQPANIRRLLKP